MTNRSAADKPPTTDQILDLLLDALLERNAVRRGQPAAPVPPASPPPAPPPPATTPHGDVVEEAAVPSPARPEPASPEAKRSPAGAPASRPDSRADTWVPPSRRPRPGDPDWQVPPREPSIHLGKTIGRLVILVVLLAVLINIPIDRYGVSLARVMPDSASLIIRDGLILKGSGPEIYRLQDNKLRWITSLDKFEHLGLTWDDVHVVEDEFLAGFEEGAPLYLLLKCGASPHIYALENDHRRWIKDIDTFQARGFVWEDVRFVACEYLRGLPDGLPIPEDAGEPPQP